jgi:hypothetical protein
MNTVVSAASLATAIAVSAPPIAGEVSNVDPVAAMIESHRAASRAFDEAVNQPGVGDRRHPQNAEAERVNNRAMREHCKRSKQLFAFRPATPAGVASLLRYISSLQDWEMPSYFNEPESIRGVKKLCKTMAAALDDAISVEVGSGKAQIAGAIEELDPRLLPAVMMYLEKLNSAEDPIFAAIEAHRGAWSDYQKACGTIPDVVRLGREGIDDSSAEAMYDEANGAARPFYDAERAIIWDLIWTVPTTAIGLATLLRYFRERESINELVADDEMEDVLEWTMECAACGLAGLPEPPMSDVVAAAWESRQDADEPEESP